MAWSHFATPKRPLAELSPIGGGKFASTTDTRRSRPISSTHLGQTRCLREWASLYIFEVAIVWRVRRLCAYVVSTACRAAPSAAQPPPFIYAARTRASLTDLAQGLRQNRSRPSRPRPPAASSYGAVRRTMNGGHGSRPQSITSARPWQGFTPVPRRRFDGNFATVEIATATLGPLDGPHAIYSRADEHATGACARSLPTAGRALRITPKIRRWGRRRRGRRQRDGRTRRGWGRPSTAARLDHHTSAASAGSGSVSFTVAAQHRHLSGRPR